MVRQNLNQMLLLIGIQKGQQTQGISIHSIMGGKKRAIRKILDLRSV